MWLPLYVTLKLHISIFIKIPYVNIIPLLLLLSGVWTTDVSNTRLWPAVPLTLSPDFGPPATAPPAPATRSVRSAPDAPSDVTVGRGRRHWRWPCEVVAAVDATCARCTSVAAAAAVAAAAWWSETTPPGRRRRRRCCRRRCSRRSRRRSSANRTSPAVAPSSAAATRSTAATGGGPCSPCFWCWPRPPATYSSAWPSRGSAASRMSPTTFSCRWPSPISWWLCSSCPSAYSPSSKVRAPLVLFPTPNTYARASNPVALAIPSGFPPRHTFSTRGLTTAQPESLLYHHLHVNNACCGAPDFGNFFNKVHFWRGNTSERCLENKWYSLDADKSSNVYLRIQNAFTAGSPISCCATNSSTPVYMRWSHLHV